MPRTTIDISDLLELINRRNQAGTQTPAAREAANELLEDVLHATGNYEGFGYLNRGQVPSGASPGIKMDGAEHSFAGCDETRRNYFMADRLRKVHRRRDPSAGSLGSIFQSMDAHRNG